MKKHLQFAKAGAVVVYAFNDEQISGICFYYSDEKEKDDNV